VTTRDGGRGGGGGRATRVAMDDGDDDDEQKRRRGRRDDDFDFDDEVQRHVSREPARPVGSVRLRGVLTDGC